MESKRK